LVYFVPAHLVMGVADLFPHTPCNALNGVAQLTLEGRGWDVGPAIVGFDEGPIC